MSLINLKLLQSEILSVPKKRTESSFQNFIIRTIDEYLTIIKKFDGEIGEVINNNKQIIYEFSHLLSESVDLYLCGNPSQAYSAFDKGMSLIKDVLWRQKRNIQLASKEIHFYRARKSNEILPKKEMFHIPFEDRHKISTKRYSIPGYPCLYLSNSIYTCWIELDRPPFETMNVCRFDTSRYRFLELSMTSHFISELYKISIQDDQSNGLADEFVKYFLIAWPVIAICSIKKMDFPRDEKVDFITEYIVPQMLMEWVRINEDLDGIKYFSTHGINQEVDIGEMINYAIPVKRNNEKGYCRQLIYDLPYTEPMFYNQLPKVNSQINETQLSEGNGDSSQKGFYRNFPAIKTIKDKENITWYIDSRYGKLEYELSKLECIRLSL